MAKDVDLARYTGLGQFGPAYRMMLENDTHAVGSVDRVLLSRMIRLCPETYEALYQNGMPAAKSYEHGTRPELERYVAEACQACQRDEERIGAIARFCTGVSKHSPSSLEEMEVGGAEEAIIQRGSDWCTDTARTACALYQVAGFAARVVYLFDTTKAYSGHAVVEVYRSRHWGAVDQACNIVYRHPDGRPASVWDLRTVPGLIEAHYRGSSTPYAKTSQFRGAAIAFYDLAEAGRYDYALSGVNAYYHPILEMAAQGWPGGLRWLHDEDSGSNATD
jgi:hypothetical protein